MNIIRIISLAIIAILISGNHIMAADEETRVIVGKDTVSMVIPEKNYGRYDRGLKNYLFIPKGDWAFGLTASMGEFDADDVQVLSVMKDFDFNGKIYSIKPSASYFFKNNQSIGVKFNYTRADASLGNLVVDFDEDINFEIRDVAYDYSTYSASVFYRRYIGLGMDKRFALFNELALNVGGGNSRFKRYYNNELSDTKTDIFEASLNFCPGVCMFIMDNVNVNVSFGVLGLYLRDEKQKTNNVDEGSRFSSGANFKFNLFSINFGIGVNI
ncbi:MAG: hypothetical protein IKA19_08970 [Muribaculaceae bacterium]|nr:hypothetical protein [Muribaculaceae bacterium]